MEKELPHLPPARQDAILNGPAMAPPPGVVPNFANPAGQTALGVAVAVVCVVLVGTAGVLRLYARGVLVRKLHVEDFLGVAALACFVGGTWGFLSFLRSAGLLVHQWDLQLRTMMRVAYLAYVYPIFYGLTMLLAKTAILLEWTRIFAPQNHNKFYWASRLTTVFNICLYVSVIVASALYCVPAEKIWHRWVPGRCVNRRLIDVSVASFNLAIDVVILVLPQPVIWALNMSSSRKIGVSIVFSVGLLACACATARTYFVVRLRYTGDATYDLSRTLMLTFVEMTCVLMVFSVPALPRLFTHGNPLSGVMSSLRSWTRLSRRSPPDGRGHAALPLTTAFRAQNRGKGMGDDDVQPLGPAELGPLEKLTFKTAERERTKDAASNASTEADVEPRRQHPWSRH